MLIPHVVEAKPEHIEPVASAMREADIMEIWAASKSRPVASLKHCMAISDYMKTIIVDGKPAGMFGTTPMSKLSGRGAVWMLGTPDIDRISKTFLRQSRKYVDEMLAPYRIIENYVDARNTRSILWLKWLGFVMLDPEPHGHLQIPFHRFYMENNNV